MYPLAMTRTRVQGTVQGRLTVHEISWDREIHEGHETGWHFRKLKATEWLHYFRRMNLR